MPDTNENIRKLEDVLWDMVIKKVYEMSEEEFLNIQVIDEYTRVAASKYGLNFIRMGLRSNMKEYRCYAIGTHLFRDENPIKSTNP